eukprot:TRINITY_DN6527_c0_g1_i1.p3 TRINITY_DN6527_c0_g1~~TRINITY_DN6527_c0_g1_i1.p3  ORF type:complete len:193 (-),score=10.04 TRINITY_DN6527_c0_g1_i1:52-630(-)
MMIVAAGLARVVTVDPTQPVMLTVALLLLLPLHLPQMVVLIGAVLVLPSGRPARVTAVFRRGLPLARAILCPAFGAPLVAWGLVLCLGDRLTYLEALDVLRRESAARLSGSHNAGSLGRHFSGSLDHQLRRSCAHLASDSIAAARKGEAPVRRRSNPGHPMTAFLYLPSDYSYRMPHCVWVACLHKGKRRYG